MMKADIQQFDILINGSIVASDNYFDAINPSTGEVFARIADASQDQMELAIASARKAFDVGPWKTYSYQERGIYLKKIAKVIRDNAKELAELETLDVGKTSKHSNFIDIPTAADTFDFYSTVGDELKTRENQVDAPVKSLTQREPRGVIGSICAYNYPMIYAAWKIGPAIMAGNCVVLKPSPVACASIMRLAQLLNTCDLPEGVINVVSSQNNDVSLALVQSSNVDMISFTGGTETGRLIMKEASSTTKKISLELGGKSPNIVFEDCDIKAALGGALSGIFINQGQMCTAGSRLFLHEKIYDEFLAKLTEKTRTLKIGDAADYVTEFGPLASQSHRDSIVEQIKDAVEEGAKIACGGHIPEGVNPNGYYLEPTILIDVKNDMTIAQEEVFGPVLCVIKFSNEEDAIRMANDSKYGLAASIWTKDIQRAERVSAQIQSGTVWVNTYGGFYNQAPFGGYKQSGFGRELGPEGLHEYTQTKHVCYDQTPGGMPLAASWF